jgi:malonyl-CoA O-methyltransferase
MLAAYETDRRNGQLPATYEVVFAQAWVPEHATRAGNHAGEVIVPLARLGRRETPR